MQTESDLDEVPVRGDIAIEKVQSDSLDSLSGEEGEKINIYFEVSSTDSSEEDQV